MKLIEDRGNTGVILLHCEEADIRMLNAPGSMLAAARPADLRLITWFYDRGNGGKLRLESTEAWRFLRLKPSTETDRRLLQILWSVVEIVTVKEKMLARGA